MGRRLFQVVVAAVSLFGIGCQSSNNIAGNKPITDARQGEFKAYKESVGDTWDPAWADDDSLYAASDDTSGWNKGASANICFNRMTGGDFLNLTGKTVNPMKETGAWGAPEGPDGRTWKSAGCISIDGTLYLVVARHMYGDKSKDPFRRQTAINSSIIKSTDHGLTWTRSFQDCYDHPMFPGNRFATPYFVYYGKDGQGGTVDRADEYIYAISNNGFWNNGDRYFVGRVKRSKIANLDASDWQFYTGGDGMRDESWSSDSDNAATLIDSPTRCGMGGATYIPALGRYVLIGWYYPRDMNVESNETRFIYYESPHPWGPWRAFHEEINRPAGWYSPRILSKWQKKNGDEVDAVIATAGDFWEIPWFYKFAVIPVKFKTDGMFPAAPPAPPMTVIKSTQTGEGLNQFNYQGAWKYIERDNNLRLGEYTTTQAGDSLMMKFQGSRIRWYSCKGNNVGIVTIQIDNGDPITLDLWTRWSGETLYNRLAYDSGKLADGVHTLTVKVTGKKNDQSTAANVYNEKVEIER